MILVVSAAAIRGAAEPAAIGKLSSLAKKRPLKKRPLMKINGRFSIIALLGFAVVSQCSALQFLFVS